MNSELHEYKINVSGMTCQGCVKSITKAIQQIDPNAKTDVNLSNGDVKIQTTQKIKSVCEAITEAGFGINTNDSGTCG